MHETDSDRSLADGARHSANGTFADIPRSEYARNRGLEGKRVSVERPGICEALDICARVDETFVVHSDWVVEEAGVGDGSNEDEECRRLPLFLVALFPVLQADALDPVRARHLCNRRGGQNLDVVDRSDLVDEIR